MKLRRIRDDRTALEILEVDTGGSAILHNPVVNKGLGFTEEERRVLGIEGLLPLRVMTLEEEVALAYEQYREKTADLERYIFLSSLQNRNETLFFRLLLEHLREMTPVVYTPIVGAAVDRYSHIWRGARGIFISPSQTQRIEKILSAVPNHDLVEAIVVTDAEAILGIGDQGAGGMAIAVGKLALYTLCGGIASETTLPVMLDVGTDNEERFGDPLYVGWRHRRLRGQAYDDFVEAFVTAVARVFPNALLQFEDFGTLNARALLERYRYKMRTFNDDIQGTGAVTLASLLAATQITGSDLSEQQVVIVGGGSAGTGIADQIVAKMVAEGLTEDEARSKIWLVDRDGLLLSDAEEVKFPYRRKYHQPIERVSGWKRAGDGPITLADVVSNLHPTVLIGTSASPGAFSEQIVREMAAHVERPIIFPLSNPTSKSEARPSDLFAWTAGRALVATGSPFPDVAFGERTFRISQCNNALIFPGVALGVLVTKARLISDGMLMAGAMALAECSPSRTDRDAPLLPAIDDVREVSRRVALAVGAKAQAEGLAEATTAQELERLVRLKMWFPRYAQVRLAPNAHPRN